MSLRTFQRMTMVGVLALGAFATGCDEDTTEPTTDAGKTEDSGPGEADAEVDSGPVVKPGKQCGATFCEKGKAVLGQCCVDDGDVCGIDLAAPGMASMGCFPENAPGVASAHCGTVLDMFEAENKVPGKFEIPAGMLTITVPTCCTPAGTCGVQGNESTAGNLGVGCLDVAALAPAPAPAADGGMPAPQPMEMNGLPLIPNTFCVAETGAAGCIPLKPRGPDGPTAPPFLLGACAGVLKDDCILGVEQNIHGCGTEAKDNWDRKSLSNVCINGIEATKFGCDPISAATLARVPEFACGCGPGVATPQCIANVPTTTCGTSQVVKGSPILAGLPNGACGCGETVANTKPPGPGFCLSRAATDACGLVPACTEGTACTPMGGAANSGLCLDVFGTGGTVDSQTQGGPVKGDDIGDFCFAP